MPESIPILQIIDPLLNRLGLLFSCFIVSI